MKNPHGVEPTRFMKRKESDYAIQCFSPCGPMFNHDIYINDHCYREDSCFIHNDGTEGYECHHEHKKSLFVNSMCFSVWDYEVYFVEYNKNIIYDICKYPDIIWEYIDTKDISEESLKQFDDDTELLNDLDAIHCKDSVIRVKISRCCLKNPSELLPDTQIVNKQYDSYLREWAGDYKWRLIYRASEHDYTAKSFHEYCDDKGPTLIVIKSSEGDIFGGYTTQSWKVIHPKFGGIYNEII